MHPMTGMNNGNMITNKLIGNCHILKSVDVVPI